MEDEIVTPKRPEPEDVLNDRERVALIAYRKTVQFRLSQDTQLRMFTLFLNGHPCEEIQALNKQFSLGQILVARLEGQWDKRRRDHVEALYANVLSRVQQTSVESVGFLADQMAAVHKHYGEKAKKYLQTGDPADFDDFGVDGIRSYKSLVETWQKLTGQERSATEVNVHPRIEKDITPINQPLPAAKAQEIIRQALSKRKG